MDQAASLRGESDEPQPHRGVSRPTLPEAMHDTAGVASRTPIGMI
jgi:hypothetical protein